MKEVDWSLGWPQVFKTEEKKEKFPFHWTENESLFAENVSIILAADVIYSEDCTEALFSFLRKFMVSGNQEKVRNLTPILS